MSRQEQELDAAEYVIGTLSGVERRVFEDLMATNKQTQEDVWYWERAFGALNASISPDAPPAEMWERIEGSLPSKEAARRLPKLLKSKKVKDKKESEVKSPEAPEVVDEPIVSNVQDRVEEETVEEIKPKKSRIWLSKTPKAAAEPTDGPEEIADEVESPEPIEKVVAPVSEEVVPFKETKTAVETEEAPALVVKAPASDLTRKLRWWRLIALVAILCILALLWWIFNQRDSAQVAETEPVSTEQPAKQYLAVVNANGDQPSLVVQVDSVSGALKVEPIGILIPEGKSLQLWYRSKEGKRVVVGLIGDDTEDLRIQDAGQGGVLEITVEPEGGVSGEEPSGPVVYSGALAELKSK